MTIILVIFVAALIIYYIQLLSLEMHYIKTKREFLITMIPFCKWVMDFKKFWDTLD